MKITFADKELTLCPSGMILWPEHQLGIVSDLHLEKGSHFAQRGFFLPPYDSQETLQRLLFVCQKENLQQLIILGDCFHDPKGYDRLTPEARFLFDQLLAFQPVWIRGNHDKDFVPEHFSAYDEFDRDGLVFRHQAAPNAINEISGHFHPKISIMHKGGYLQRDCFVTDGRKLIVPAFGAYTGGMAVDSDPVKSLFIAPVHVYALGEERVFSLPSKI